MPVILALKRWRQQGLLTSIQGLPQLHIEFETNLGYRRHGLKHKTKQKMKTNSKLKLRNAVVTKKKIPLPKSYCI